MYEYRQKCGRFSPKSHRILPKTHNRTKQSPCRVTDRLTHVCDRQFKKVAAQAEEDFKALIVDRLPREELRVTLAQRLKTRFAARPPLGLSLEDGSAPRFVESAVGAFLDQDLLQSVRLFLRNAKGSFGLFVSSSLDAHRQFVLAARGQTISLAFYPKQGLVLWGSEQVRAPPQNNGVWRSSQRGPSCAVLRCLIARG